MIKQSPALKKAVNFFLACGVSRRRILATVLISLFCTPATFGTIASRQLGQAPTRISAPITAPPEPYVLRNTTSITFLAASVFTSASNVIAYLTPAAAPEGLGGARMPTLGERVLGLARPLVALVKPSASSVATTAPPQPSSVVDFDFDNDGKADIGRWHGANTEFKVKNSNGGSYSTFTVGSSSAVIAPGDFNGDGKTDAVVFSAGTWKYKTSTSASEQTISWGTSGDIPVAGDYDGDGTTDAAIYRPSTNTWWIAKSTGGNTSTSLGSSGDIPVPGDYDGDGKNDLAVFRPSNGNWYINPSNGTAYTFNWGIAIDTPVPADYDGDGKTDPAVFRPSTGTWYAYKSGSPGNYFTQAWGNWADQPVPGDYDGDNKADFSVWRPTTGVWYTLKSSDSSFSIDTLGVPGDTAVPSAYLKQVGGQVSGDAIAAARLRPRNATGGTNLYSQNFSWGTSLVSLPGRAGLDAGFGIGYNSLVWTKVGSAMVFDADRSNASPGFRFGFPTIEPVYYDDEKDVWAYMMITSSGARTQFRQTVVTNTYETADSSYAQLITSGATNPNDPVEDITIKVTTTNGTQLSYAWSQGAYRCTQIKDRNGNYISNSYDGEGRLSTMTDTLGRVGTVNYETTTGLPSTITQQWKTNNGADSNITHTWATFTYKTEVVNTDFSTTLTVVGPPDDTEVKVLDKITYPDGSSTKFEYNGYLQVKKVSTIAAYPATHVLNSVETSLVTPGTGLTDCPRFTSTSTTTDNFNGGNPVTVTNSQPVSDTFSFQGGALSGSGSRIDVAVTGHPNDLYSRIYLGSTGWNEGLTLATEDCAGTPTDDCSTQKRWAWTDWTQDYTSASYITNPRVKETRVGDSTNVKVTKMDYRIVSGTTNTAEYGLVSEARVYEVNDLTNPIKKIATDYNLSSAYTSRRIIGLPSQVEVWGKNDETSSLEYVSKVTYGYDEENFSYESNQIVTPARHDTNYGSSFVVGRGNLTSTSRHDVTAATAASVSKLRYDIAGSPVAQLDPRDRKTKISYSDNFNSTVSPATFAYPTTITDPANSSSTIQYRFDIGANVWAQSPTPYGASAGKTTSRTYDTIGRLEKDKIENTGAYTRYTYPNNDGVTVKTYSTIADVVDVGTVDASDEVLSETLLDGAGRVRMTRTENPNSTGGYTGKLVEYDLLGRVKRETVPTEIDLSWNPDGDDDRGSGAWLWNSSEYDWKGRVTREINTDGTDKLYSYDGCGCAGGQVTTIKGEITEAIDASDQMQTTKRRTQKIHDDILGRVKKTEIWDLDGAGGTPYSTTVNRYNGRDQVIVAEQHAGGESATPVQNTTFEFDGHGRLKKSHKPEQKDSNSNATYTTYAYNADDTVATMTDPRGAVTTYKYGYIDEGTVEGENEYRNVLTKIEITSPDTTNIPDPGDVGYAFDPAGNRKKMTDASGMLSYSYDSLSRLVSETKSFDSGILSTPRTGGYTLQYTYHLTGGIKSITDPHSGQGWSVGYTSDKIGRTTAIGDATGFGSQGSFAGSIAYRAFGGVKSMMYATSSQTNISVAYDNRLRPVTYEAESSANTTDIQNKTYTYTNDGSIKQSTNTIEEEYSQKYEYDFASRIKKNDVGGLDTQFPGTRYKQTLGYDKFDNLTSRSTIDNGTTRGFTADYTDNRKTSGGYQNGTDSHDAAGNIVGNSRGYLDSTHWKFDAAGRVADWDETSTYLGTTRWDQGEAITFDGDGRTAKRNKRSRIYAFPATGWSEVPEYHIYSSVTGQNVMDLDDTGARKKVNIYMGSTIIAQHTVDGVAFKHTDPVTGSVMQTTASGEIEPGDVGRIEAEPLGAILPTQEPELNGPPHSYKDGASPSNPGMCSGKEQTLGLFGPMPCRLSETFVGYLQQVYGPGVVWALREHDGLGTGGMGADGESTDGPSIRGLHVSRTISEAGRIEYSWASIVVLEPGGVKYAGFTEDQQRVIDTQLAAMFTEACANAFRKAGLATPLEMYKAGISFVHNKLLGTIRNNGQWDGTEPLRAGMRAIFDERPFTGDVTPVGAQNGRYYVGLHDVTFGSYGPDTPQRTIIHSLIHAGGAHGNGENVPNYVNFPADRVGTAVTAAGRGKVGTRTPRHDLEWMNFGGDKETNLYESIMRDCSGSQ